MHNITAVEEVITGVAITGAAACTTVVARITAAGVFITIMADMEVADMEVADMEVADMEVADMEVRTNNHNHYNGGGIYIGGGGIGLGYGSSPYYRGYGGYGGYYGGYGGYGNGLGYYSGYRGYPSSYYYNSYPVYRNNVYTTPYVYQSTPVVVSAASPSVQSSIVVTPASIPTQSSELPGVTFGARSNINLLADAVAQRANALCVSLHQSYSGNPQFNEIYRDTYLLITMSKQLASVSNDPQATIGIVSELNAVLTNVSPAIERFQPSNGAPASATSLLSRVTSAVKLLSVDAGWDGTQPLRNSQPSVPAPPAPSPGVAPAPAAATVTPPAVAPGSSGTSVEPTPADPPVPAP